MDVLRPLTHSEVTIIPSAPSVGNVVMYAYNGLIYAKDSAGNITQMQGGDSELFPKIWAIQTLNNCE